MRTGAASVVDRSVDDGRERTITRARQARTDSTLSAYSDTRTRKHRRRPQPPLPPPPHQPGGADCGRRARAIYIFSTRRRRAAADATTGQRARRRRREKRGPRDLTPRRRPRAHHLPGDD